MSDVLCRWMDAPVTATRMRSNNDDGDDNSVGLRFNQRTIGSGSLDFEVSRYEQQEARQ